MTGASPTHLQPLEEDVTPQMARSLSSGSLLSSIASIREDMSSSSKWKTSRWRHPLGIALLLVTVCLWTTSNFLASTIFADNTYSKPYFVTYINSSFFVLPLIPALYKKWRDDPQEVQELLDFLRRRKNQYSKIVDEDEESQNPLYKSDSSEGLHSDSELEQTPSRSERYDVLRAGASNISSIKNITSAKQAKLTVKETAELALPFCFLWFFANYFSVACLEYTTVGSATILTSTSSIWTLICGTFVGVERFTVRKLCGVLASLAGIVIISSIDINGGDDTDRGTFPHKTAREIAIGDALAFVSAAVYGIYAVFIKKRLGDESRVNMPLFLGLVGLLNLLLMWPGFVLLHVLAVEPFALPPTRHIVAVIAVNSTSSLVSDFCWAFAMLLTSPLIVTVGLSLTIPLSLVGQIFLSGLYAGWAYWLGAAVVVASFVFVNHEESKDEESVDSGLPGSSNL